MAQIVSYFNSVCMIGYDVALFNDILFASFIYLGVFKELYHFLKTLQSERIVIKSFLP